MKSGAFLLLIFLVCSCSNEQVRVESEKKAMDQENPLFRKFDFDYLVICRISDFVYFEGLQVSLDELPLRVDKILEQRLQDDNKKPLFIYFYYSKNIEYQEYIEIYRSIEDVVNNFRNRVSEEHYLKDYDQLSTDEKRKLPIVRLLDNLIEIGIERGHCEC